MRKSRFTEAQIIGMIKVHCYPNLDRLRLEFWALFGPGGLVAPGEFASRIGGIFPSALCGLSSL